MPGTKLRYEKIEKEKWTGGVICECVHCGDRFGSKKGSCALTCANCKTAEQRAQMHSQNADVWVAAGKAYQCQACI